MAGDTGKKIAMFFAGLGAIDIALSYFLPSISTSMETWIKGTSPYVSQFYWVIFAIYGISGGYVLYKTFSK